MSDLLDFDRETEQLFENLRKAERNIHWNDAERALRVRFHDLLRAEFKAGAQAAMEMGSDVSAGMSTEPNNIIKNFTPEQRKIYDESLARWDEAIKPVLDAIRRSERITGDDLNLRMNTTGPIDD